MVVNACCFWGRSSCSHQLHNIGANYPSSCPDRMPDTRISHFNEHETFMRAGSPSQAGFRSLLCKYALQTSRELCFMQNLTFLWVLIIVIPTFNINSSECLFKALVVCCTGYNTVYLKWNVFNVYGWVVWWAKNAVVSLHGTISHFNCIHAQISF